jgi:Tfp pilus assembly protein PilE
VIFILAALVTAFALPAYRSYTLREHSKLASIALEDVAARSPGWLKRHPGERPLSLEDLGFSANAIYVSSDGTTAPSANINSVYRISVVPPDAPAERSCGLPAEGGAAGFVLLAEPVQMQRIDQQCGRLCLGSLGRKAATGSAGTGACWRSGR